MTVTRYIVTVRIGGRVLVVYDGYNLADANFAALRDGGEIESVTEERV